MHQAKYIYKECNQGSTSFSQYGNDFEPTYIDSLKAYMNWENIIIWGEAGKEELKIPCTDKDQLTLPKAKETIEQVKKGFEECKEAIEDASTKYEIYKVYECLEYL